MRSLFAIVALLLSTTSFAGENEAASLAQPSVTCFISAPNVYYSWDAVDGAEYYEMSADSGVTWVTVNALNAAVATSLKSAILVRAMTAAEMGPQSEYAYCSTPPAGIFDEDEQAFKMFPNPASTAIYIENAEENVVIYDVTGSIVAREAAASRIRLTIDFAPGIYFVKSGELTKRLVVR